MKFILISILTLLSVKSFAQPFQAEEIARWKQQARRVTIIRDNWGVPHIYGKSDADAVFGALYVQCEDDFERVEENYLTATGRKAEVDGESFLIQDLRARMFMDSVRAARIYEESPKWMKQLLNAFADGINYYLYTHPEASPRLLRRFQPWMPLTFTEGSIGGNISVVPLERIRIFYMSDRSTSLAAPREDNLMREPVGSNGFAIAPSKSATKKALLLINPHTSFYFRSELHMISKQGLNAYGAVTWGQFFIYQGFNQNCGWMHTSSDADAVDEYLETVEQKDGVFRYKYGNEWRPVKTEKVTLSYKQGTAMKQREYTIYRTHHGPVVGQSTGKWIAVRMMDEPLNALSQSYLRTKARDYQGFNEVMKLRTNSSNNTVFADSKGNIAYWHGDFMPRRDPGFNWAKPVDGSNPATDWKGLHEVGEIVQVLNPASGWIQNCNSTPFTSAGKSSPAKEKYPGYMAPDAENYRAVNAAQVLGRDSAFTLDKLITAAYDPYLAGFEPLIPALVDAYQKTSAKAKSNDPELAEAIGLLSGWDRNYGQNSVETTLAIYWAEKFYRIASPRFNDPYSPGDVVFNALAINYTTDEEKVSALREAISELERDFGNWKVAWGDINRFQRLTGKVQETFDDRQPSLPVAFPSAVWGSLASYGARAYADTKKRYGSYGNSFVAVVEFGKRLTARSVVTGGQSSKPGDKHFMDQAPLYCEGKFKDVRFYPEDVKKDAERTYKPGEK